MTTKLYVICFLFSLNIYSSNGHTMDFGRCKCACKDENDEVGQIDNPFGGARGPPGPPGKQGPPGALGNGAAGGMGSSVNPGQSCSHLKDNGVDEDGIYFIKPSDMSSTIQVFCDMTSNRNGKAWTLVASVHDNNPGYKCTTGDKWSSELGLTAGKFHSSKNWENTNVFGGLESATSADYKNNYYHNSQGSDIMVWHVPNNTPLNKYKEDATVMYTTTDGFMGRYGGNLRTFYKDHFPLVLQNKDSLPSFANVNNFLEIITNINDLTNNVNNNHQYSVVENEGDSSGPQVAIADGGGDMFDDGNKISLSFGDEDFQDLEYDKLKAYPPPLHMQVKTTQQYPFVALSWIGLSSENRLRFRVFSDLGADGDGRLSSKEGALRMGNFEMFYTSQQAFGSSDASVVKIYFVISNENTWKSTAQFIFQIVDESSDSNNMNHEVLLEGPDSLNNLLFGYVLLSKQPDNRNEMSNREIESVLNKILLAVSNSNVAISTVKHQGCSRLTESLAVPVQFIRGRDNILHSIPDQYQSDIETGFIHFRAFGNRIPTAFCSGFKSKTCFNQEICVGGVSAGTMDENLEFIQCGDFAGQRQSDHSILIFYDT